MRGKRGGDEREGRRRREGEEEEMRGRRGGEKREGRRKGR